jgi:Skp family chaperone for outer membrane proteins
MHARCLTWSVAFAAAGLAAGCNRASVDGGRAAGAVAVIDLDAIAHRLGSDKQIADAIAKRQSSLSQHLVEVAKSYSQQIEERKKSLATAPDESEVTLATWQQQASENLTKVKQQAQQDLQKHRAELVAQFRDGIRPVARRVAQSRGLSVIVTKNDSVLYDFAPSADITEAVLVELQSERAPVQP